MGVQTVMLVAIDFGIKELKLENSKLIITAVIIQLVAIAGAIGMSRLINAPADGHTLSAGSPMELVLAPMAIQGVKYKSEDFKAMS